MGRSLQDMLQIQIPLGVLPVQRAYNKTYNSLKSFIGHIARSIPLLGSAIKRYQLVKKTKRLLKQDAAERALYEVEREAGQVQVAKDQSTPVYTVKSHQVNNRTYTVSYTHTTIENTDQYNKMLQRLINIQAEYEKPMEFSSNSSVNELRVTKPALASKLETEVVKMCTDLYHGTDKTCGTITASNTDGVQLAIKTYRDYAKETLDIDWPEIIVPTTAHEDFINAALDLGVKVVIVPVEANVQTPHAEAANVNAIQNAITKNTVLIVSSAPSEATGNIDPIKQLAKIAQQNGIGLHVDATASGFLLPLLAAETTESFDLRLEGVTTFSLNTNRDGKTTCGPSVLLFRSNKLAEHQQSKVASTWPWSNAIAQTETEIPKAWAAMVYRSGPNCTEIGKQILVMKDKLVDGIRTIDGIEIVGQAKLGIIAICSKTLNAHHIAKKMKEKGFSVSYISKPKGFKINLTTDDVAKPDFCKRFLAALAGSVHYVKSHPSEQFTANGILYGMMRTKPSTNSFMLDSLAGDYSTVNSTQKGVSAVA